MNRDNLCITAMEKIQLTHQRIENQTTIKWINLEIEYETMENEKKEIHENIMEI